MYRKIIFKDIEKNKFITLTLVFFIAISSTLFALSGILATNLIGSIDNLLLVAKTPHFLQMHKGELDYGNLLEFSKNQQNVESFQVIEFLNLDNQDLIINEISQQDSLQDNGLVVQSEKFDYLLDTNNEIIQVEPGNIYLPILYKKSGYVNVSDVVKIKDIELIVGGFLRDSQMNSELSSSKRFLVNEKDFQSFTSIGSMEYLIEFRLFNLEKLTDFENSYRNNKLASNGPTITYNLFRLINALNDGIQILVMLMISFLIVLISFLCIRFTILTKIEDDYSEIGILKAIGIKQHEIKNIYSGKYILISGIGSFIGFAISIGLKNVLLNKIQMYMGISQNDDFSVLFALFAAFLIFIVMILFVNRTLQKLKTVSPVEAITKGSEVQNNKNSVKFTLLDIPSRNLNFKLAVTEIFYRKKLYLTIFALFIIVTFLMIFPKRLLNTISDRSFISYLGMGQVDIGVDVRNDSNSYGKSLELFDYINTDTEIDNSVIFQTKNYNLITSVGSNKLINIELGDHSIFPLKYLLGDFPKTNNELAISSLLAEELNLTVGSNVKIELGNVRKDFTISGIYSDVTNGGKTAKGSFLDKETETVRSSIYLTLKDPTRVGFKTNALKELITDEKVFNVSEYVKGTFGGTISALRQASIISIFSGLFIIALVTSLFIKLLLSKDKGTVAIQKAIGFTNKDLKSKYLYEILIVLALSYMFGMVIVVLIGDKIGALMLSSLGIMTINLAFNPINELIIIPLSITIAVIFASFLILKNINKIGIAENIKE